jgi:branched-chain amino acid transport system ATP-binding protein
MDSSTVLLRGTDVTKRFGGLAAVNEFNFQVSSGEITGLIGPNGAGKTTLFNVVSGVFGFDSGSIEFDGIDISKMPAHKITQAGLARTFQLIRAFDKMKVIENVTLGGIFGNGKSHDEARESAHKYLDFVELVDCANAKIGNLTPFDKKKVELAATLNTEPKLILLDEFVAGLNEGELNDAISLVKRIQEELGITVFWIEHVMKAIMSVAKRIIVIHYGEKIAEGPPREIAQDKDVITAYLGSEYVEECADSAKSE